MPPGASIYINYECWILHLRNTLNNNRGLRRRGGIYHILATIFQLYHIFSGMCARSITHKHKAFYYTRNLVN